MFWDVGYIIYCINLDEFWKFIRRNVIIRIRENSLFFLLLLVEFEVRIR